MGCSRYSKKNLNILNLRGQPKRGHGATLSPMTTPLPPSHPRISANTTIKCIRLLIYPIYLHLPPPTHTHTHAHTHTPPLINDPSGQVSEGQRRVHSCHRSPPIISWWGVFGSGGFRTWGMLDLHKCCEIKIN